MGVHRVMKTGNLRAPPISGPLRCTAGSEQGREKPVTIPPRGALFVRRAFTIIGGMGASAPYHDITSNFHGKSFRYLLGTPALPRSGRQRAEGAGRFDTNRSNFLTEFRLC